MGRQGHSYSWRYLRLQSGELQERKDTCDRCLQRSWQLEMQYIPKKRAMSTISDEEIRMIQNRLNNRPRKRLGFKTPAEVFHQSLKRFALRT